VWRESSGRLTGFANRESGCPIEAFGHDESVGAGLAPAPTVKRNALLLEVERLSAGIARRAQRPVIAQRGRNVV
jgi:hypothetical protein